MPAFALLAASAMNAPLCQWRRNVKLARLPAIGLRRRTGSAVHGADKYQVPEQNLGEFAALVRVNDGS